VSVGSHIDTATRIPGGKAAAYGPAGRSLWMDVDWRAHQRWITVDGQTVNTIELGPEAGAAQDTERQPLVFIHGLSGCWANWLEQLPVLAREHRVVTLDLPGFGYSPMPSDGREITISGYARLLDGGVGGCGDAGGGDQHEPLDALREGDRELGGDEAAHRVADDDGRVDR
jgi:pimeloyl-ACP methyl ester carboxylesterase